jgi:hypothetical protein
MKAVADRPPVPLEPNYPIFYMFNGRLCRGRAVSQNADDYATVTDTDDMNREHYVELKDIYAVDPNFPGWRYPPVDFCGRILNGKQVSGQPVHEARINKSDQTLIPI